MSSMIRRDRRPLAFQVRDRLAASIRDERLQSGDQVPSEAQLVSHYRVARTTVREALKLLEQDGLIRVQAGRGRFVSATANLKVERPITRFESVTDMLASRGYTLRNAVVGLKERTASMDELQQLRLSPGATVIQLERVRSHNREPLMYSVDVFPRACIGQPLDSVDWSGSLLKVLRANGRRVVSATSQISAALLPRGAARVLDLDGPMPWLLIVETCYEERSVPVLYAQLYHRGDVFSFNVLRRSEE